MPEVSGGRPSSAGRLGRAGVAVTVAGFVVNGFGYVVPVLGARQLSAGDLGALAAVLALGAVAAVPALGLQTALAVRWAKDGQVRNAGRLALATTALTVGILVAATPLITALLHISALPSLLLAATIAAVIVASRWLGQLQGAQRFGQLAVGMVLLAVARYGGVIAGLAAGAGVTGSLAVGAVVAWLTLPVLALLASRAEPASDSTRGDAASSGATSSPAATARPDGRGRLAGRDIFAASGATLAMLAISYADLILARYLLPPADAGAYAVGAVLTKGALWAPQVVTILALPRLAQGSRRALIYALAVVAACDAVLVAAAFLAGDLAIWLAGGPGYAGISGYAPGFAAVGALYALVFVLVNAEIAARARFPAAPLWVALAGLATVALLWDPPSLGRLLTISVTTAALTTLAMGAVVARTAVRARTTADFAKSASAATPAVSASDHGQQGSGHPGHDRAAGGA